MYTGLIANRYAKALAAYAAAGGEERRTYDEVKRLIGCYREDATLREALFSPVLSAEKILFRGEVLSLLNNFAPRLLVSLPPAAFAAQQNFCCSGTKGA